MKPKTDNPMSETAKGTCLSRMQSLESMGRNSAAAISEYILARPEEVLQLTLAELAARVPTSVASISRFCNLLGYENYRAFQIDLTASLAGSMPLVTDLFSRKDDPDTIIKRVFELNRQCLADTQTLMSHECLIDVAKLVMKSRRLCILGIGGSGLAAQFGAFRLASLGIAVLALTDPYGGLLTLSSASANDVVIAVSHSGRSEMIIELLKLAKEKGARTVGITNYADSALAKACEFVLLTSLRERRVNAAVSSSGMTQMCILDAIYFVIAHFQGPKAEKRALEIEKAAEDILRTG